MKYKLLYAFENSFKGFIRTEGMLLTIISIFLISLVTFLSLNITFFLFHWGVQAKSEALESGLVGFQALSPILLVITLFKFLSLLLSLALLFLVISHVKHTFSKYANLQNADFMIMSFIGQTPTFISYEFALQTFYTVIIVFSLSHFIANRLVTGLFLDISKEGLFTELFSSFKLPFYPNILITLLLGIYMFFRVFYLTKKQALHLIE